MKRQYEDVKLKILTLAKDVVTESGGSVGFSTDPNVDDGYDLSGFTE